MPTYQIKVLKDGRPLMRKQIIKGLVQTEAVVIKAASDQVYVISDALLDQKAPAKIQTRKVGQHLHVTFGEGSIAAPDLIIEGYFDVPPGQILGTLTDGSYAAYDLSTMLNGTLAQATEVALADPQPYAGLSGMQWAGVAAGLGALGLAGGGGGGGGETTAQKAQNTVNAYAADSSKTTPTVADYNNLGVSGVTATNVAAINSAIDALGAADVDTVAKVQAVVSSYNKILDEANGSADDATPSSHITASQFASIGVDLATGTASPAVAQLQALSLLNAVIGNKTTADVDTVAEINALAAAVNAVMNDAAGVASVAPTVAQLNLLGITGVNSDNLAAIQAAIAATPDNGTGVDTTAKLQAVVDKAVSLVVLQHYADSNTQAAPTLADYGKLEVTGVTTTNLAAINSAIDALGAADVDTVAKVQAVVSSYNKILDEANGSATDTNPGSNPFASDYAAIGAHIGLAKTNDRALSLLNDVVGTLSSTAVDTVAEIDTLAATVDKIMNVAAGTSPFTDALNLADWSRLGIATAGDGAVTNANHNAVLDGIAQAGGQQKIDTLAELQTLVKAVATIATYADDNTQLAPTTDTYSQANLTGVNSGNVGAINSAMDAHLLAEVDTKTEMQLVIDSYVAILAEANGSSLDATPDVNPTAAQYAAIGANIGASALDANHLALLNDAIGGLGTSQIDTVAEINALAATIDKVMNLAALPTGTTPPTASTAVPTMADLNAIGLNTVALDTPAEQTALWQAIIDSPDNGTGVLTVLQLQALINANTQ